MNKSLLFTILFTLSNIVSASDVVWLWDNDGATKGLYPDQTCQCYFSLDFPDKVIPLVGTGFTLFDSNSQIVTLETSKVTGKKSKNKSLSSVLSMHLDYEYEHLKGVVGNDKLSIERSKWNKESKIMSWVLKRESKSSISYLVSNSIISSDCIFYLTSVSTEENMIPKLSEGQQKSLKTLRSHRPSSKAEAEKLLLEFGKS